MCELEHACNAKKPGWQPPPRNMLYLGTFLSPESCYQICFQCPAPTLMLLSIAPRNPRLSLPTFLLVPSSALLLAYLYALVSLPEHAQIDDRESRCDPLTLTMWQWS
jgi:hypothetical protein